jgi:hypothetical protein
MIMWHLSLSVMALVLVLCGNALAQQKLVRHKDQNDSVVDSRCGSCYRLTLITNCL